MPESRLLAGPTAVVLDLRELCSIDKSGVDALADANARSVRDHRRIVILRGPPDVECVFRRMTTARELEVHDLDPAEPPVQVLLQLAAREPAAA